MSNILFIGPIFNGYEKTIFNTIKNSKKYNTCLFLPDCPIKDFSRFGMIKIFFPSLATTMVRKHNLRIQSIVLEHDINVLFIIRGEFIDADNIKKIKELRPKIKIVVYQWDSIKNNPNSQNLISVSDKAYSFDYLDVKQYEKLNYLSLFSSWTEFGVQVDSTKFLSKYDLLFIGGNRNSRVPIINNIKRICKENGLTPYVYCFERFWPYIKHFRKLTVSWEDLHFRNLSYKKYYDLSSAAKVILDIQSPTQSGLTMRTFEALSLGKKLVTTNKNIINESFYNEDLIFILDDPYNINEEKLVSFLKKVSLSSISDILSLTSWLKMQEII